MTKKEWIEIAELLVGAYGANRFQPEALRAWYTLLEEYSAEDVKRGVVKMIKAQPYPTISEIVKSIEEVDFWDPRRFTRE